MNNAVIIFSGFNHRAIIAFCRVAKKHNIPFYIVASCFEDAIFMSIYKENIVCVRKSLQLSVAKITDCIAIIQQKYKHEKYIILPSTEALNRFILSHKAQFINFACDIPLVDEILYNKISDKYSFGEICQENGVLVPQEIPADNIMNFPIVAKPKKYYSDSKINTTLIPYILGSYREYNDFNSRFDTKEYYFQEYIDGLSYYLLFYFGLKNDCYVFSQKNLVQQPFGKSIVAAMPSDIHKEDICIKFIRLFNKIGFKGLIMVEVKYDNGKYYMIEANPRLWGPSQLFVDCGVPFFEYLLLDYDFNLKIDSVIEQKDKLYFWFGGLYKTLRSNNSVVFHDYSMEKLIDNLSDFLKHDIYCRSDTARMFLQEVQE